MENVTVICDRCKKKVHGIESPGTTGGFYRRAAWFMYMEDGENIICDECMFANPEYTKIHGKHEARIGNLNHHFKTFEG